MRVIEILNRGSKRLWLGVFNEKVTRQQLLYKVNKPEAYQIVENMSQDYLSDGSTMVYVGGTIVGYVCSEKPDSNEISSA